MRKAEQVVPRMERSYSDGALNGASLGVEQLPSSGATGNMFATGGAQSMFPTTPKTPDIQLSKFQFLQQAPGGHH